MRREVEKEQDTVTDAYNFVIGRNFALWPCGLVLQSTTISSYVFNLCWCGRLELACYWYLLFAYAQRLFLEQTIVGLTSSSNWHQVACCFLNLQLWSARIFTPQKYVTLSNTNWMLFLSQISEVKTCTGPQRNTKRLTTMVPNQCTPDGKRCLASIPISTYL